MVILYFSLFSDTNKYKLIKIIIITLNYVIKMCLLEDLPATQAVAYKSERKRKVSIKTVTFLQRLR